MKRNLTLLTILGALIAVAVPASAMAATSGAYPAGHGFQISGENMPQLTGSLAGSCTVTKIAGTIPAAPKNEVAAGHLTFAISAPTASCTGGMSITIGAGEWKATLLGKHEVALAMPESGITLRYSSLPGCKAVNATPGGLGGIWSNGLTTPIFETSGYHADSTAYFNWLNDGASCALAGTSEKFTFASSLGGFGRSAAVIDTTKSTNVIQFIN